MTRAKSTYAQGWAELIGKVGKELGPEAARDTKPVVFHFYTPCRAAWPLAFRPTSSDEA